MEPLPVNNEKSDSYNTKAIKIIALLVTLGIITGLILSYVFVIEANDRIENFDDEFRGRMQPPPDFTFEAEPLTPTEIILPTLGVIIICISTYLLMGLIIIYLRIFMNTNSRYIAGLLFFLSPLCIQSVFSIAALRSLFVSSAIPFNHIRQSIGFEFGGFGSIMVIVAISEIIGLSILLYLSTE